MADTKEKAPAQEKKQGKGGGAAQGGGKGKDKGAGGATDHAPKAKEGTPRLQEYYEQTVRPRLAKEFGLANPHQIPRVEKIVSNVGMGDASHQRSGDKAESDAL